MVLRLTQVQQTELGGAAIAAYPQECCGLLLGTFDQAAPENLKQVTHIWPTRNAWSPDIETEFLAAMVPPALDKASEQVHAQTPAQRHSPRDRFWIDPRELLRAQKWARAQGWVIVGIYHSHPDHPAVPSERDRLSAWPDYSYVILSVSGANAATPAPPQMTHCNSWVLDAASNFQRETLH